MSSDFIVKEIFVQLQKHYKETKFRSIHKQDIQTVPYWKWWQILLNICGNWRAFTVMHAFSSVFFLWTMSNGYKIHLVTMDFFIDCCKLTFTCYFFLFLIEFYSLKKTIHVLFLSYMLSNWQVVTDTCIKCFKVCLESF